MPVQQIAVVRVLFVVRVAVRKPEREFARRKTILCVVRAAQLLEKMDMLPFNPRHLKSLARHRKFPTAFLPAFHFCRNDVHPW